ncbi:polysaccharide biosynthesis/export family protein [Mariniflexile litorale]|uniref:Polysaccharide biosynthesis/export family protein n=1 Tax=Mariniflexile litorale TaxID=3045158 RepID=A0AAU7EJ60_9FLAO|nr:polysaccharide biosynthesis/export family protein [Mariniflexile sp. KMM 9835]MDQ8209911.1 polysaccharide biosynthesis/export family protein [Mariniflexile sp. KMM 9835]
MKKNFIVVKLIIFIFFLNSCATKRDLLYLQDANNNKIDTIHYQSNPIQCNDILSVTIGASVPETSWVYNKQVLAFGGSTQNNLEILKLQGYLVNIDGYITLPILGNIHVVGKSINDLELELINILEKQGHLMDPSVSVRILNAKVTVLGEVKYPGTYSFTEQYITFPQALGYAGDLTINGKRNDLLLIREINGERHIIHIDLTNSEWMKGGNYIIRSNDIIIVNPNTAKIKSAGYVGNAGTLVSVASVVLSSIILLTR